ncbi:MAG TPA: SRPBCC domain-containing protein [Thermoanaerobaculia bacterium]|jgi:hypothetical protein|nr:SRPBCC domain-containing protein [Thermoanaerobaculia bacterium]
MRKLALLIMIAAPLFAADSAHRIEREVAVHASRAEVWKAWTTVEGARFFAPAADIELRPGGAYEIYFWGSSTKSIPEPWRVLRELVLQLAKEPDEYCRPHILTVRGSGYRFLSEVEQA